MTTERLLESGLHRITVRIEQKGVDPQISGREPGEYLTDAIALLDGLVMQLQRTHARFSDEEPGYGHGV